MEEANYDYEKLRKVIKAKIEDLQKRIREIEQMSDEAFMEMISKSLFGVANKGYYINKLKKRISDLEHITESIDYLLDLWKNDKKMLEWVITHSYQGYTRKMRKAIERLAQSRFNAKLLSFLG